MGAGGYDPGRASHAALLEIRRALQRHPAVVYASADPAGRFTRVRAEVDPRVLGGRSEAGSLTVRWYAGASPGATPEFVFPFTDADGFDCGWHHEPNPHVDRWGHYQERRTADGRYAYEPVTSGSHVPVRVVWEGMERLAERLERLSHGT